MHLFCHARRLALVSLLFASCSAQSAERAGSAPAGETPPPSALDPAAPVSAAAHDAGPPQARGRDVPLVTGLTIVTAVHQADQGDYESIKRVSEVNKHGYTIEYSADIPTTDQNLGAIFDLLNEKRDRDARAQAQHVRSRRTVNRRDQLAAREYLQYFAPSLPTTIPGTTAIGVSHAVFIDLVERGAADVTMRDVDPLARVGSAVSGRLREMAGELAGTLETSKLDDIEKISGTLRRVADAPSAFALLLDGQPVTVPAITASGTLDDQPVELVLLDSAENPIALSWKIGSQHDLRVVQIQTPAQTPERTPALLEQQLIEMGRAAVYGIYFDFNSDAIKPESEPVLAEIAGVLRQHPDWSLAVEGHTDSIGDADSNRHLSERRAAAVKAALVERHGVHADRLETAGIGESRPKASNESLDGRAQNRRVELARLARSK